MIEIIVLALWLVIALIVLSVGFWIIGNDLWFLWRSTMRPTDRTISKSTTEKS
jgi:hypothetical protein